jgi:hypothetical protein
MRKNHEKIRKNRDGAQGDVRMNIEMSDDILKRTTKCYHGLSCLSGEPRPVCKVEEPIGTLAALTNCEGKVYCPYCIPYGISGNSSYCTCPVRIELYRRYKI